MIAGPAAVANPASAAAAGSAAFFIANCAFSPAVSKFLNSAIAREIPFPSYSEIIGIDNAITNLSALCVTLQQLHFSFHAQYLYAPNIPQDQ